MKIKISQFKEKKSDVIVKPFYAKDLDVGADVSLPSHIDLKPGITKVPLNLSIELPNGFMGLILPRSGNSSKGLTCEPVPIDPSYTGNIHAIVNNTTDKVIPLPGGYRIAQLVIIPIIRAEFVNKPLDVRGDAGFGSTGN